MNTPAACRIVIGGLVISVGTLASGPALTKMHEWANGVKFVHEERLPPLAPKKKPLDTPGTVFDTVINTLSSGGTIATASSGSARFTAFRVAYPTTEFMPGAVTTPAIELINLLHGADYVPAAKVSQEHRSA